MIIRNATIDDLDTLAEIEKSCFPCSEAALKDDIRKRLLVYPEHFWILERENTIISFINGMVTDEEKLTDEMFSNANLHYEYGKWQMIFSVCTVSQYQKNGYAKILMEAVIKDCKKQNRKGLVLTCKEKLIHYYKKFGFINEGISKSVHGGAVWYDMRLYINEFN